ncbi:hypothetical protein [Pseudolabrys sp. Root1462]|uniref:hypothetical protein n=1 Tax=Pseudolabrys sp. Root1462 TaxID=1736466 RepID=UPI0012E390EC|nr:hypothetical protein [Pseudolabrys sp. Root1462]
MALFRGARQRNGDVDGQAEAKTNTLTGWEACGETEYEAASATMVPGGALVDVSI